MPSPTTDIIVPVWNNPFETRACLAAILDHSPEARLIIIDNGSNRETELMLEEFSELLGERALFMTTERNIGLVPSINRGLASSNADYAVIVRPHVKVSKGWLKILQNAAAMPQIGIVSPLFRGCGAPTLSRPVSGCELMETFSLSFATILLKGVMLRKLGGFDEVIHDSAWCLQDYVRRAEINGYRTCVSSHPELVCGKETIFGSQERRKEQTRISHEKYLERWGTIRHYCLYFGPKVDIADLTETIESIVSSARLGHRFTLMLHRKQFRDFRQRGWNKLHTSITIFKLPMIRVQRGLARQFAALKEKDPDLTPVRGSENALFPGIVTSIDINEVLHNNVNGI